MINLREKERVFRMYLVNLGRIILDSYPVFLNGVDQDLIESVKKDRHRVTCSFIVLYFYSKHYFLLTQVQSVQSV